MFRSVNQFSAERGGFKKWLIGIAYHRTLSRREHLESGRFYSRESIEEIEDFNVPGRLALDPSQETLHLVQEALATLKSRQRTVIELTYFEGLTAVEAAERTGRTAKAIRNDLYRALAKLRIALTQRRVTNSEQAFKPLLATG